MSPSDKKKVASAVKAPAKKRKPRAAKSESAVADVLAGVVVDFPQQDECVVSPIYTIRVGANEAEQVEVSINGSLWEACRPAEGYWWYDWQGYLPGRHQVLARMYRNGQSLESEARRFRVESPLEKL
jgi:hypothetical protein